jgi:hypothetical protein
MVTQQERDILERAVRTLSEQAAKASELVDEAKAAGGGDHPVHRPREDAPARAPEGEGRPRAELEDFSLNCSRCGLDVHWVSGLGVSPGHWAHREPAPHGAPAI